MIECRVDCCQEKILRTAHLCPVHWNIVPRDLQAAVNRAYQYGTESVEYKMAGDAVAGWLKARDAEETPSQKL